MDFGVGQLFDSQIRSLKIVDNYSRQCLAIEVNQGIKAGLEAVVMERLSAETAAFLSVSK